jgi:predicted adenine nucleotide alpha hydrolase (AANH) superfamily ATPase
MPPTDEDLAWFRSTFHPIPRPQLPDDCVEYCLYIFNSNIDPGNESELRLHLREVQKYASELQKEWLKEYIWQRQDFRLELKKEDGEVCLINIRGQPGRD